MLQYIQDPETVYRLEDGRAHLYPSLAVKIQARGRAFIARKTYKRVLRGVVRLQACVKKMVYRRRFKKMKSAAIQIETDYRRMAAKKRVKALRLQFKNKPPRVWAAKLERVFR